MVITMKKNITILYITTFAIFLCLPHLFFFLLKNHVDTTNYENRSFYEAPVIGETSYKDFARTFESYYNDRIPFRNQLIAMNNNLNYFLFHSTTGDQVLIGKDGWLYIADKSQGNQIANYLGKDTLKEDEIKLAADNLVANARFFEEQGIEFMIFVSPNKSRVYPEYMPDYMGEPAEFYQLKQVIEYLEANTDLKIVYDYDEIMKTKEALKEKNIPVYHKVDTHWNYVGAYAGAKALLEEGFGKKMPEVTELTFAEIPNTEADLGGMLHMKDYFMNTEINFEVTGYEENGVTLKEDDDSEYQVIEYNSKAPDDRTLYVYRDSFAKSMGKYLGSQFKRVYMRHHNTYTYDDLMSVKPDVFVLETTERGSYYEFLTFNAKKQLGEAAPQIWLDN